MANEQVESAAETPLASDQSLEFLNAAPDEFDALPTAKTEAASAPAAQSTPAKTAAPTVPAHPPALIREAREVGVDERIIGKLDTDELMDLVLGQQRKFRALEDADARVRNRRPEPTPQAAPVVDEDEEELAALEAEGHDPRLIKQVRKQKAKADALESGQRQRNEQESQRRTNEAFQAVDDSFAELGPKFEKIVGKGELTAQSETIQNRRKSIFRAAGVDVQMDAPRVIAKKIAKAAMELFGDVIAEPAKEAAKPDAKPTPTAKGYSAEQWDRGTVERPTSSRVAKEKGQRAAAAAIHDEMQRMGLTAPNGNGDDFDGLPD